MSMEKVKQLRARTNLGMNDCKKALEEAEFDVDKALEILQKKGLKNIDPLIIPTEGAVCAVIGEDFGRVLELNCQTDFGARSDVFLEALKNIADHPSMLKKQLDEQLAMVSRQLGEKVILRRSLCYPLDTDSVAFAYNHLGGKVAVLVIASAPNRTEDQSVKDMMVNLALQIAAMRPLCVERTDLDLFLVRKKRALFEEEIVGKPENVKEKIIEGKLNKWYSEVVLLDQEAIFQPEGSPKQTVRKLLEKLGTDVVVKTFIRYERGEEF